MNPIFRSACDVPRPIRLSPETRAFAMDSLNAVYGRDLYRPGCLQIDDPDMDEWSQYQKYDACILKIARECPLRICPGERLVGSATLLDATRHVVPVKHDGEYILSSISHVTPGFDRLLERGVNDYERRIRIRMDRKVTENEQEYLKSLLNVIKAMHIFHERYMMKIRECVSKAEDDHKRSYYETLAEHLRNVPFEPPQNFQEGLQALWIAFSFTRLCGNWPGLGRVDQMLGGLLERDLANGILSLDEARELVAHFFIKGCEWIKLDERGSGDGQHYQNIVLAGVDEDGREVANALTYLILDVVEELPIGDFPIAVRINDHSPDRLLRQIARVMRHGSGVCAVYNENLIIKSLTDFHYDLRTARRFANDGCWEVQIPGETRFGYHPLDAYEILQERVLHLQDEESIPEYPDFQALLEAYLQELDSFMEAWHAQADQYTNPDGAPASVISLLIEGCIDNARDYLQGGARYNVLSPHMGGIPDAANSLKAIKQLVYDGKKLTLCALREILKNNWEGYEPLRRMVAAQNGYFGNDAEETDELVHTIVQRFIDNTLQGSGRVGVLRPAGISTFGRQIEWREKRGAGAQGSRRGDILSGNLNPAPGTDREGATAIIRSHCKADLSRLTCGTALDIKLDPTAVQGEEGVEAIMQLIRGFCALGGFFMQIDVIDNQVLLEAQKHPEQYQNLAVRISGWSARFVTLDDEWQRMIIERSAQARC